MRDWVKSINMRPVCTLFHYYFSEIKTKAAICKKKYELDMSSFLAIVFLSFFGSKKSDMGRKSGPSWHETVDLQKKSIVMGKLECSFFKMICWDVFWLLYIEHLYFQLIFSFNIACDEYIGYFLQLYMWVYTFLWKHSVDFVSMTGLPEFDLFTCIRSWEPLLTPSLVILHSLDTQFCDVECNIFLAYTTNPFG